MVCVVLSHGTPLSPPKHRRKGIGKNKEERRASSVPSGTSRESYEP